MEKYILIKGMLQFLPPLKWWVSLQLYHDWGDFEEDLNIEIVNNLEKTL